MAPGLLALALTIGGCAFIPPIVVVGTQAPTPISSEPDSAESDIATQQVRTRAKACVAFSRAMDTFIDASDAANASSSREAYEAAVADLAYELAEQAPKVGDTGADGLGALIANLSAEAARFADELRATSETSTSGWLAFQSAIKAAGAPCDLTYNFDN